MKDIEYKANFTESEMENLIDAVVELKERCSQENYIDSAKELQLLFVKLQKIKASTNRKHYRD